MTEETKMILERLDVMGQDIKDTKCIALQARDAANEAKLEVREAKVIAIEARDAANEAKLEAREAKAIAMEARDAANEAKVIAMEARDAANKANDTANEALQIAKSTQKAVEELDKKVVNLQTTMENELRKQIKIIGEAHDFLKMKLDQALAMEKERERMWLEILNLRIDMRNVKEKLCIV